MDQRKKITRTTQSIGKFLVWIGLKKLDGQKPTNIVAGDEAPGAATDKYYEPEEKGGKRVELEEFVDGRAEVHCASPVAASPD